MVSEILPGQNFKGQGHYGKIKEDKILKAMSLWQDERSNKGTTMTLHTYNPQPMSLSGINILHLTVSEM